MQILREAKEVAEFTESDKAQATACRKQSVPTLTSYFEQHNGNLVPNLKKKSKFKFCYPFFFK